MWYRVRNTYTHRPAPINAIPLETGSVPKFISTGQAITLVNNCYFIAREIVNRISIFPTSALYDVRLINEIPKDTGNRSFIKDITDFK